MGQGLFDAVPEFLDVEAQVDQLLGYSVRQMCLEDPGGRLQDTQYTQPCLYVVNALHYYQALADGARPDALAGHSLGEYNALLAAGAFDFLTGLALVKKRGELMSQVRGGMMTTVLGLPPARISEVLDAAQLTGIDIAAFNGPGQTVLAGPTQDLVLATRAMMEAGAQTVVPLPVSAPFHSRYMAEASLAFEDFLADVDFRHIRVRVVANVTGRPYPVTESSVVRSYLVKQIVHPVQWTRSMRYLLNEGASSFREIGPGHALTSAGGA